VAPPKSVMWTRVLPEPRCPELEPSPFPPRRPVSSSISVSVWSFYRGTQCNISYSTVDSLAKASGAVTPTPPVDNSPTNPEFTIKKSSPLGMDGRQGNPLTSDPWSTGSTSGRTPPAMSIACRVPYLDAIYDQCSESILHTMDIYASFFFSFLD
jgi:hypothetical protein